MQTLTAALAFVRGRWIDGVEVRCSGGVIRSVRRLRGAGRGRILLPGLVNAHTHLELTRLEGRVRRGPFTEWARRLMEARSGWTAADVEESLREGIRRSIAAGTAAVGDFAWLSRNDAVRQSGLRAVSWREALGLAPERAAEAAERAGRFIANKTSTWTPGLAPHAPYSCSAELYGRLFRTARRLRIPFATHLSELREEIDYLRAGKGPFRDMLKSIGRDAGSWTAPRKRPVAYLAGLGVLRGATVAHANYLSAADIALLRTNRAVVVWCPRTHEFFRHAAHPVKRLIRAGIPVALGTDSLASSPDLSIRAEMSAAVAKGLSLETVVKMATEYGSRALGLRSAGRIAAGCAADFTVIGGDSPGEALSGPILDVIVAGKRLGP